jgi:hypothetical protein
MQFQRDRDGPCVTLASPAPATATTFCAQGVEFVIALDVIHRSQCLFLGSR